MQTIFIKIPVLTRLSRSCPFLFKVIFSSSRFLGNSCDSVVYNGGLPVVGSSNDLYFGGFTVVEFSIFGNKNNVETTCLKPRFPRLSLWQVAPHRNTRRFTNLFSMDNPKKGLLFVEKRVSKNKSKSLFLSFLCLYALFFISYAS